MKKIILVDDEKNILEAYKRNLMEEFDIITAVSGESAIEIIKKDSRIPVIVTDYKMPGMNGVELLERVREISPDTVQIMLTGQAEMNAIISLINKGRIFRFLTKPCSSEDLIGNIRDALRQYELITAERELLGKTLGGSIKILVDLLALAKPLAFTKTQRIRSLSRKIYQHINSEKSWQMEIAATLSQIGTVTIPDDILTKSYRGLTLSEDEKIMYNNHPVIGAEMIKAIPRLDTVAEIIKYQLKNYDGTGSPGDKISEERIPLGSRIIRIAMDFDNILCNAKDREEALEEMKRRHATYDIDILIKAAPVLLDISSKGKSFSSKEIHVDQLKEGMFLAEDVTAADGTPLGGKNQEVTQPLIAAFRNYENSRQLKEKIKVITVVD